MALDREGDTPRASLTPTARIRASNTIAGLHGFKDDLSLLQWFENEGSAIGLRELLEQPGMVAVREVAALKTAEDEGTSNIWRFHPSPPYVAKFIEVLNLDENSEDEGVKAFVEAAREFEAKHEFTDGVGLDIFALAAYEVALRPGGHLHTILDRTRRAALALLVEPDSR